MSRTTIIIAAVTAAAIIAATLFHKKIKCRPLTAALALLVAGGACALCAVAVEYGTIYSKPQSQPQDTVTRFFDSLLSGDYDGAYACLYNYADLSLGAEPETEDARRVYDLLRDSYGYSLLGGEVDGLSASQRVSFTFLDMEELRGSLQTAVEDSLAVAVETTPGSQVYDENRDYLPEFVDGLYSRALEDVLARSGELLATEELSLELEYMGGDWYIVADAALLNAICGNAVL